MTSSKLQPSQLSLSDKTKKYWEVSSVWHGTLQKKIATGTAINITNELENFLGPERPLKTSVLNLKNQIVYGASKDKKKRIPATITQLRKVQAV